MRIGIIGYGHVEKDKYQKLANSVTIAEINHHCDCVPTDANPDDSCDVTIVEEVIKQLDVSLIIIRSAVYIGFTDEMIAKYAKEIVFQPEYYCETVDHPFY